MNSSFVIPWNQTLTALSIPFRGTTLPVQFKCQCRIRGSQGEITVFRDYRYGAWFRCSGCNSYGNMIDLTAFWRKSSWPEAIRFLESRQIAITDQASPHGMADKAVQAEVYWSCCKNMLADDYSYGEVASLLKAINLDPTGSGWVSTVGQLIGATTKDNAKNFIRGWSSKEAATLRAVNWKTALVLPFFDMPNRVGAFLFIGDDESKTFLPIPGAAETGISAWHTLQTSNSTVFLATDPLFALRLQNANTKISGCYLPIASRVSFDRQPFTILDQLCIGKEIIVIGTDLSGDLVWHAKQVNGKASHGHSNLKLLIENAKPWPNTMVDLISTATDDEIKETWSDLNTSAVETQYIISISTPGARKRLQNVIENQLYKTVRVNYATITETPDGWFNKNELITDGVLRIDRIICQETDKLYEGRIMYKNEVLPFVEEINKFEYNPFKYMRDKLLSIGIGPMVYNSKWSNYAINIAEQLQKPNIVHSTGRIGWDADRARFVFNGFSIYPGTKGVIEDNYKRDATSGIPSVGTEVVEPHNGLVNWISSIDDSDHLIVWSLVVSIIRNIIASALNEKPLGIALVGKQAISVGTKTSNYLACPQTKNCRNVAKLTDAELSHDWPVFVQRRPNPMSDSMLFWLGSTNTHNCIVPMDHLSATVCAANGDWVMIESQRSETSLSIINSHGMNLIPSYIARLCQKHLDLPGKKDLTLAVAEDLKLWLNDTMLGHKELTYLNGVDRVCSRSKNTQSIADLIGDVVALLYLSGDMALNHSRSLRTDDASNLLFFKKPNRIFIPKASVVQRLSNKRSPTLDNSRVTDVLFEAGLLLEDGEYRGQLGWYVPEDWLQERIFKQQRKLNRLD